MTSVAVVGSTGLVGSHILSYLLSLPSIASVHSIARRQPASPDPKLQPIVSTDTSSWSKSLSSATPSPSIFFSGLGTTAAAAGGFENQKKIDLDLNVELARAAKDAGVKVYVLISSGGANSKSSFAYIRMKGELDDIVKEMGFEKTILVKPGIILGPRNERRLAEGVAQLFVKALGGLNTGVKDRLGQDADVIGRAAVKAGLLALEGKAETDGAVWELNQADIVRLGKE